MVPFSEVLDILKQPQALHAAAVHAPIVLSMLAALVAALSALLTRRVAWLPTLTVVCLSALVACSWVAANAGEDAFARIGDASLAARQTAVLHRAMGEKVWLLSLGTLVLACGTWLPRARLGVAARIATAGVASLTAAWTGLTAHHGGTLVYKHGVGLGSLQSPTQSAGTPGGSNDDAAHDPRVAFFNAQVRPLLAARCMSCHGPGEFAASGLSLITPAGFLAGGKRGPALVPGDPKSSLILHAVRGEGMPRMPYLLDPLDASQIEVLERWIREGAVWR